MLYQASPQHPYHLSVGTILITKMNTFLVLYYPTSHNLTNIVKFPTGTIEENEPLESTVKRELLEETGLSGKVITYLGMQLTHDNWWGEINQETAVEKATAFFLVALESDITQQKISKELQEKNVTLKEFTYQELVDHFSTQQEKDGMRDFNQIDFLHRAQKYLEEHATL